MTVAEVLDWHERHELREYAPIALKERQRLWRLFCAVCGSRDVSACTPADLLTFIASQKGARSNWTRRRIKSTINRPFNVAAEVGLIARNPFRGLKIPEGRAGRDWTAWEYRLILRHATPNFRRLIIFLRFGGARPGEARTVKWSEVQSEVAAVVQERHKTSWANGHPRRIHFNGVLVKLLAWMARHKAHPVHVFASKHGTPWTIKTLVNHFNLIRVRAGLGLDVKLHGARHTFATHAILNGVDVAILAELLGHRNIATTQRYLHLAHKRDHLNAAMERAIGRSQGS